MRLIAIEGKKEGWPLLFSPTTHPISRMEKKTTLSPLISSIKNTQLNSVIAFKKDNRKSIRSRQCQCQQPPVPHTHTYYAKPRGKQPFVIQTKEAKNQQKIQPIRIFIKCSVTCEYCASKRIITTFKKNPNTHTLSKLAGTRQEYPLLLKRSLKQIGAHSSNSLLRHVTSRVVI